MNTAISLYRTKPKEKVIRGLFSKNEGRYMPMDNEKLETNPETGEMSVVNKAPELPSMSDAAVEAMAPKEKGTGTFSRVMDKMKGFFKAPEQTPEVDEYGLEKPQEKKQSGLRKLMNYAVPMLFGLSGGAGILPGVMAGMGEKRRSEGKLSDAMEKYNESRSKAISDEAKRALEREKMDALNKYRQGRLGLTARGQNLSHADKISETAGKDAYLTISPTTRAQLEGLDREGLIVATTIAGKEGLAAKYILDKLSKGSLKDSEATLQTVPQYPVLPKTIQSPR